MPKLWRNGVVQNINYYFDNPLYTSVINALLLWNDHSVSNDRKYLKIDLIVIRIIAFSVTRDETLKTIFKKRII